MISINCILVVILSSTMQKILKITIDPHYLYVIKMKEFECVFVSIICLLLECNNVFDLANWLENSFYNDEKKAQPGFENCFSRTLNTFISIDIRNKSSFTTKVIRIETSVDTCQFDKSLLLVGSRSKSISIWSMKQNVFFFISCNFF